MTRKKLINYCDQAISYLILGLIFLLPLYFTTFTYLTFEVNKVVLFRVAVEILFIIYALRAVVARELTIFKNPIFYWSLGLILFSQLIATGWSAHTELAWWGSYWRSYGFFTQLHLFFFAYLFFNSYGQAGLVLKRVLYALIFSGFLASVYGILQVCDLDFLKWQHLATDYLPRANSTLGQPNYLASYLLLIIPLGYYLFKIEKTFKLKIIWLVVTLVLFWALVLTYSRAAWLGLAAILTIIGLVKLYKKSRLIFGAILVLVTVIMSLFLYISFVKPIVISPDNSSLTLSYRLKTFLNAYQGSNVLRINFYEDAQKIIAEAPWFGQGLDTQQLYFYKYYQPDYALFETIYVFPDRAHNELLDILITTGIVGLLAWLFLFLTIARQSYKYLKLNDSSEESLLVRCISLALLACWLSLMFGFFNITVAVYFWLMIAWLFHLMLKKEAARQVIEIKIRPWLGFVLVGSLTAFVLYFCWQVNVKLVIADYYYRQARIDLIRKDYGQAITDYNQVFKFSPGAVADNFYKTQVVVDSMPVLGQLDSAEDRKALLDYLIENNLERKTTNFGLMDNVDANILLNEIGRNKLELGVTSTAISEFKQAETGFRQLASEAPGFAFIYYNWGNLYFDQAAYAEAALRYKQALKFYPDLTNPDLNLEHYNLIVADKVVVLRLLAETQIALKQYNEAFLVNQQARLLAPVNQALYKQTARIYYFLKQPEQARAIFEHQIFLRPLDDENYYQLALLERALGNAKQAEKNIKSAIKLKSLLIYQLFLADLNNQKINQKDYLNIGFTK